MRRTICERGSVMGRKRTALIVVMAGVVGGAFAGVATGGPADARTAATHSIGPRQHFIGLVNGHAANAIITMVCTSPLDPGETGHPLEGQTIAVEPPPTTARSTGYTGTRGNSVIASFVVPSTAGTSTITFTKYGSQPIPDTLSLPCGGSGVVVFSPKPTSGTAQSDTVKVTYGNITADPPRSG